MTLLVDTGPLVALADRDDRWHARCVELFDGSGDTLFVPLPVVTEACHMLCRRVGSQAEASLLAALVAGELEITDFTSQDLERAYELVKQYSDLPLGFTDAVVVATAERLEIARVATTDRRHFSVVRPSHVSAFELVPDVP